MEQIKKIKSYLTYIAFSLDCFGMFPPQTQNNSKKRNVDMMEEEEEEIDEVRLIILHKFFHDY